MHFISDVKSEAGFNRLETKREGKVNYTIITTTLSALQTSYSASLIEKGNYVFVFLDYDPRICVAVSEKNFDPIVSAIDKILALFKTLGLTILFLIEPKSPPENGVREDNAVTDFAFREDYLMSTRTDDSIKDLKLLCHRVALKAIKHTMGGRILARTFDDLSVCKLGEDRSNHFTTAIPHQGDIGFLEDCLRHIGKSECKPQNTWVYFDEALDHGHIQISNSHKYPLYRKIRPSNLGPYIARNHCVQNSTTEYICFQDSDDVPTFERFIEIYNFVAGNSDIDMAGCHELRVDDLEEQVTAIRFPIDVSKALTKIASHPLFHPTSFAKCSSIKNAGLFSTARRFGSDSQFLLRAHFSMRIKNIDKFLYIRRKREGSLTTSPEIKLGSEERTRLILMWKADFERVKSEDMELKRSSLATEHLEIDFDVLELRASVHDQKNALKY